MSFIELTGDLSAAEGAGASSSGLLGSVVRQGLSEGLSANQMLEGLQQSGIGIRRSNFLDLVRNIRSSVAAGAAAQGLSLTDTIPRSAVGTVTNGIPGVYRSNVTMTFRGPSLGGERMIETSTFTITHQTLLAPADIIGAARDIWSTHSDLYDSELLDTEYSGTVYNPGQQ